jgi:hypothetical protein
MTQYPEYPEDRIWKFPDEGHGLQSVLQLLPRLIAMEGGWKFSDSQGLFWIGVAQGALTIAGLLANEAALGTAAPEFAHHRTTPAATAKALKHVMEEINKTKKPALIMSLLATRELAHQVTARTFDTEHLAEVVLDDEPDSAT